MEVEDELDKSSERLVPLLLWLPDNGEDEVLDCGEEDSKSTAT